jgi:hypothetical protein
VEEKLDSARHRDAITKRGSKAPVAGGIERRAVEGRCHATHDPHPCDVPLRIDIDLHRDVAACAAGSSFLWVISLLLLEHLRWLDGGCFHILRIGSRCRRNQGAKSEHER